MDACDDLTVQVGRETDDILCSLQLVWGDRTLEDRLFGQLVDLLIEGLFLDVRARFNAGELSQERYTSELTDLANQCRDAGLLPLAAGPMGANEGPSGASQGA